MSDPRAAAVLVAAGRGERLGTGVPKGLVPVAGIPMLAHAARPLVGPAVITAVIHAAIEAGAASAGLPVREAVKRVEAGYVAESVDRDTLWIARTPQAFRTGLLREAHARAAAEGFVGADDAVLTHTAWRLGGASGSAAWTSPRRADSPVTPMRMCWSTR